VAFAAQVAARGEPLPRARDLKVKQPNADAFLQFARNTVAAASKPFPAPLQCVEAVAASLKPFDEGLQTERTLFQALMQTPESRALRHVFQAERAAAKVPGLPEGTVLRPIARVGVIGAGTMGGGITMNFLNAGIPVVLLEMKQEALDRGLATIRKNYENSMKKGKLKPEQVEQRMGLITPTLELRRAEGRRPGRRGRVRGHGRQGGRCSSQLDAVAKPGAILASNTSYLDIDRIATFTQAPAGRDRPALLQPGQRDAPAGSGARRPDRARRAGHQPAAGQEDQEGGRGLGRVRRFHRQPHAGALRRGRPGPDQRRRPAPADRRRAAEVRHGHGPVPHGRPRGPDIGWATRKRKAAEAGVEMKPIVADKLCEAGRFGQKTGAGWYRYEAGNRTPLPDP
jgi:3-hydroxyacyl-CoA dehydrogenase